MDLEIYDQGEIQNAKEFSVEEYPKRLREYMQHKFHLLEDSTQMDYQRKFDINFSKFSHLPIVEALESTIRDLFQRYKNSELSQSTFRIYRASLCYGIASYYEKWRKNELIDEVSSSLTIMVLNDLYQQAIYKLDNDEGNLSNKKPETSSLKAKRFDQGFYEYLVNIPRKVLKNPSSQLVRHTISLEYDQPIRIIDLLKSFVKANMLVGLRPIEWRQVTFMSDIENQNLIMRVKNAKHSHGRANGEYRNLVLTAINKKEVEYLLDYFCLYQVSLERKALDFLYKNSDFFTQQTFFSQSGISSEIYEKRTNIPTNLSLTHTQTYLKNTSLEQMIDANGVPQAGCADKLNRSLQNEMYKKYKEYLSSIGQELTDASKRPTLYSTRHQCIANAKASGKEPMEIAGFFGHASDKTNRLHYGKKSYGWSGWGEFKFTPTAESILQVDGGHEFLANCKQDYFRMVDKSINDVVIAKESSNHYDKWSANDLNL